MERRFKSGGSISTAPFEFHARANLRGQFLHALPASDNPQGSFSAPEPGLANVEQNDT